MGFRAEEKGVRLDDVLGAQDRKSPGIGWALREEDMMIPDNIAAWLLESTDPSLRYRAYTELLGHSDLEERSMEYRRAIDGSPALRRILGAMHPEGYWLFRKKGTPLMVGDGVEYLSAATTHYCLAYLSEMGATRANPLVEKAADRYMGLQSQDGDWYLHMSCLYGYNIKTFLKLGYRDDERIGKSVELLMGSIRSDNGYLCDMHEKKSGRRRVKSCIRGSVKALEAFAELGEEFWTHPSCMRLVDYFLDRGGIYKRGKDREYVNKDVQMLIFPFLWSSGLVQILYCLGKMGYGNDGRLKGAWDLLESKKEVSGEYPLDWTPTQCPWKVGKRGTANKWISFYAYLAEKYRTSSRL
jgi:hypothetical protein